MIIRSTVAALQAYTPGEQPEGPGIIKLNTNENPYPPSPRVEEALRKFDVSRLRRYPDPIFREARARIAAAHGCSTAQVIVGNGSDELLSLCARAFVPPDGAIGYFEPSYSLYPVLADSADVARCPVALSSDFTWQSPAGCGAALFFLANPNAPTGMAFARGQIEAFCRAFEGAVVIDEAYADFADDNCLSLALAPDLGNALVLRTLSKSFSLAGLRFGYAIGPEELINALYKIKDSYNQDMLALALGAAALEDLAHMRANVSRIRATRGRLSDALTRLGWQVCPSQTNFVFARPPDGDAIGRHRRLKAAGIYVRHFPGPITGSYLRITVGTDAENDALLRAL